MRITIELDDDEARALLKASGNANALDGVGAYGAMQIGKFVDACKEAEKRSRLPLTDTARWIDSEIRAAVIRVEQIKNAPARPRLVLEGSVMHFKFIA